MLGLYDNFPENIHRIENFVSALPDQKLQKKLIQTLQEINRKPFSFKEIGHPTMHDAKVIFEVGIAEGTSFTYIDAEETKILLSVLKKQAFRAMDFFVAVRYHKDDTQKRTLRKFDYYMIRFIFVGNNSVELQIFHERGPRHTSPEDVVELIEKEVNGASAKKILRKLEKS
jgi:hypothetical protein